MIVRETSCMGNNRRVRARSCPGNVFPGNVLSGKVIVRETSVTPTGTDTAVVCQTKLPPTELQIPATITMLITIYMNWISTFNWSFPYTVRILGNSFLNILYRIQYHICCTSPDAIASHEKKYIVHLTIFHKTTHINRKHSESSNLHKSIQKMPTEHSSAN